MRPVREALLGLVVALGGAAITPGIVHAAPASADKETARKLMQSGDALFRSGDHAGALSTFRTADKMMNVPSTRLAVALAEEALGQLVEARKHALEAEKMPVQPDEPPAFARARDKARELAESLQKRIPTIEVVVEGVPPGAAHVELDGTASASSGAREVDPGKHTVRATAPGTREAREEVTLKEGEKRTVRLALVAEASPTTPETAPTKGAPTQPAGSGTSPLVYVGFGIGGVGLVMGSVTGFMTLSRASKAKSNCVGNECDPAAQSDIDAARTLGTVSTISFGVGLVGAGVGVYGLLRPPTATTPAQGLVVRPWVGPGNAGIAGSF